MTQDARRVPTKIPAVKHSSTCCLSSAAEIVGRGRSYCDFFRQKCSLHSPGRVAFLRLFGLGNLLDGAMLLDSLLHVAEMPLTEVNIA